jgi:hypothetical protein
MKGQCTLSWRPSTAILKIAFELSIISIFIGYGIRNWDHVRAIFDRLSLPTLCTCIIIYSISHIIAAATTMILFRACGYPVPYRDFLYIHLRRLPAKYIPGGIWQTVSRGSDLVKLGVPTRSVVQILSLEQLLAIWWSGFIGFGLISLTYPDTSVQVAALITACVFLTAPVLAKLALAAFKPNSVSLLKAARTPAACLGYLTGWCCLASAFTIYILASGLVQVAPIRVAASYLVSWMFGAIAFFSPQGMGVFEVVMQHTAFQPRDKAYALWFIGSYRLVVLSADLLAWLAATLWHRRLSFSNLDS